MYAEKHKWREAQVERRSSPISSVDLSIAGQVILHAAGHRKLAGVGDKRALQRPILAARTSG